jgi:hypothetical protein
MEKERKLEYRLWYQLVFCVHKLHERTMHDRRETCVRSAFRACGEQGIPRLQLAARAVLEVWPAADTAVTGGILQLELSVVAGIEQALDFVPDRRRGTRL